MELYRRTLPKRGLGSNQYPTKKIDAATPKGGGVYRVRRRVYGSTVSHASPEKPASQAQENWLRV